MNNYPSIPDSLLVSFGAKYQDTVETGSGHKFFIDTRFRPEWHVTIKGRVLSAPRQLTLKAPFEGVRPIAEVGDEVLFSYLVLFDRTFSDDLDEVFFEEAPQDIFITVWSNRRGMRLLVRYRLDDRFDCAAFDTEGNVYSREDKLTVHQKDAWLSRYKLRESSQMQLSNILPWQGEDLAMVHYGHLLAVKRGEAYLMADDYVLLEEVSPSSVNREGKIILLNPLKNQALQGRGVVVATAPGSRLKKGDRVVWDSRHAQEYEIEGKTYKILKERRLLALQ